MIAAAGEMHLAFIIYVNSSPLIDGKENGPNVD